MAVRRVNTLGAITKALIYWGGLTYWRSDALFGTDTDAHTERHTCMHYYCTSSC